MPVLDTVVLFAAADPLDKFHKDGVRHLRNVGGTSLVGTSALMEFDIVLKSRGRSASERMKEMALLVKDCSQCHHFGAPDFAQHAVSCHAA